MLDVESEAAAIKVDPLGWEINRIMKILFTTDNVLDVPYETLVGANLNGLNLHRAIFEGMNLCNDASFVDSDLRGAFMASTDVSKCDFSGATLMEQI